MQSTYFFVSVSAPNEHFLHVDCRSAAFICLLTASRWIADPLVIRRSSLSASREMRTQTSTDVSRSDTSLFPLIDIRRGHRASVWSKHSLNYRYQIDCLESRAEQAQDPSGSLIPPLTHIIRILLLKYCLFSVTAATPFQ